MKIKKIFSVLVLSLLTISILSACGSNDEKKSDNGGEAQAAFNNELFFAGSSTLAPAISQIADVFTNEYRTWDQVDSSLPAREIQISVSTGGSGAGARAVLDGTANFGMLARASREAERNALAEYQDVTVGIDALLIAVQKNNPLATKREDVNKQELRRVFSGEISRWNELDPALPVEEIVLLVRDVGGGAHGVFQRAVMDKVDVSERAVQVPSMSGLVSRLAGNSQAIGYVSYGVAHENRDDLAVFSFEGITPESENIIKGIYPIARPLVLVWNGQLSIPEQAFMDYILSAKGVEIISEMGFLPVR